VLLETHGRKPVAGAAASEPLIRRPLCLPAGRGWKRRFLRRRSNYCHFTSRFAGR